MAYNHFEGQKSNEKRLQKTLEHASRLKSKRVKMEQMRIEKERLRAQRIEAQIKDVTNQMGSVSNADLSEFDAESFTKVPKLKEPNTSKSHRLRKMQSQVVK